MIEPSHSRLPSTYDGSPPGPAGDLRRRLGAAVGVHRPAVVVQVEHRVRGDEVHVRRVVGVDRADVAPVPGLPLVLAGHDVGREVVDVGHAGSGQRRDHVAADVGVGVVARRDDLDQRLGVEHVVAHRGQAPLRVAGHRRRVVDLLVEVEDPPVVVDLDDAEVAGLVLGNRDRRDRDAGADRHGGARPSAAGPSGRCGRRRTRTPGPGSRRGSG